MDDPSEFHMRKSYAIKLHIQDPNTPTYMEALPSEHSEEYYKDVYDGFNILIIKNT